MLTQVPAGRAAATLALKILRGVLGSLAKDGMVSLADIDRAIALIERGSVDLDRAFESAQKRSSEAAEQAVLAVAQAEIEEEKDGAKQQGRFGMRSDPLHRILALPLEKMFYAKPKATFERKFLSAYFSITRQLIGPQFVAHDAECKAIIQSMLQMHGQKLDWETVYVEPRSINLMRRVFGALTTRLSDERTTPLWMERMLQPATDGTKPTEAQVNEVRETILAFFYALPAPA